jgi:hypothetical protein
MEMPMNKRSFLIIASIALSIGLVFSLGAETGLKPRLSVVTGIEAGQNGGSAFGAENAQTVLAMITAYAIETQAYEVIGTADREAAIKELEFSLSQLAEDANQLRLGKTLAAQRLLSARCGKAGDYFVVQLSLVDVETGAALGGSLGKYRNIGTLLESLRSLVNDCLGLQDAQGQGQLRFITVRNSTEFLNALGSDRVVTLMPGTYDLSQKSDVRTANLTWKDNYDGFYPIVKSVSNLTLRGSGEVEILIAPSYGWVLEFQTSQNLRFQGIRFAHRKPGYCMGGVLRFELCDGIEISDCVLDGSGTYGIELSNGRNLTMNRSRIQNCSYGIMQLFNSNDALFLECEFSKNREFDLIELQGSSNIDFSSCDIHDNSGSALIQSDEASYSVVFTKCKIYKNNLGAAIDTKGRVRFAQCEIGK